MCNKYTLAAIAQIKESPLSDAQRYVARSLLDLVESGGYVGLEIKDALAICRAKTIGSMRNRLSALKKAGIITYGVRYKVFVWFTAWPEDVSSETNTSLGACGVDDHQISENSRATRANSHQIRETSLPTKPKAARIFTKSVRIRARTGHDDARILTKSVKIRAKIEKNAPILPSVGGTIGGVGWDLDPIPSAEVSPTNQPATADAIAGAPEVRTRRQAHNEDPPPIADQARSMGLLLAVGMIPRNARRLAAAHPAERVLRAVAYWWDHAGTAFNLSPGIVVKWLDDWENTGLPMQLSSAFCASDLYRRFGPPLVSEPDDGASTPSGEMVKPGPADEPDDGARNPAVEPDHRAKLWAQIVAEYQPGAQLFLRQARLVALADGRAQIRAPRSACDWLRCQLQRRLTRSFAAYGHVVQEVIIQEEGSHASTP